MHLKHVAPGWLQWEHISRLEAERARLLAALAPEVQRKVLERQREAAAEQGGSGEGWGCRV